MDLWPVNGVCSFCVDRLDRMSWFVLSILLHRLGCSWKCFFETSECLPKVRECFLDIIGSGSAGLRQSNNGHGERQQQQQTFKVWQPQRAARSNRPTNGTYPSLHTVACFTTSALNYAHIRSGCICIRMIFDTQGELAGLHRAQSPR